MTKNKKNKKHFEERTVKLPVPRPRRNACKIAHSKCQTCGRQIPWGLRVCDECYDREDIEFKSAHGCFMTFEEWLIARKLDGYETSGVEGYKKYAAEI